jgi:hypothetical protein
MSRSDATGFLWLVAGVLVVAAVGVFAASSLLSVSLSAEATDLGIGFAWLLAATYVGFRMRGAPGLRLRAALALVVAAVAQFAWLLWPLAVLEVVRLVAVVAGAALMLVAVGRE